MEEGNGLGEVGETQEEVYKGRKHWKWFRKGEGTREWLRGGGRNMDELIL